MVRTKERSATVAPPERRLRMNKPPTTDNLTARLPNKPKEETRMLTMIAAFAVVFVLSVIPGSEVPHYKQDELVFWSVDPVICEKM